MQGVLHWWPFHSASAFRRSALILFCSCLQALTQHTFTSPQNLVSHRNALLPNMYRKPKTNLGDVVYHLCSMSSYTLYELCDAFGVWVYLVQMSLKTHDLRVKWKGYPTSDNSREFQEKKYMRIS